MYPASELGGVTSSGGPCRMATDTPMLRADVKATDPVIAMRSPTRIGFCSSIPSTDAVTTGRRQWRVAASTPTTSIHSRILPARM